MANSVTLDNPTEDGYIYGTDDNTDGYPDTFTRNNVDGDVVFVEQGVGLNYYHGYVEWNITSIPSGATITKVEFRYHGEFTGADTDIRAMANRPSTSGDQTVYDDAADGTAYLLANATFVELGTGKDIGGASGPAWDTDPKSDLQTAVTAGQVWFAFGFRCGDDDNSFYSEEYATVDPKPTLYVEYTLPHSIGVIIG